MTFETVLDRMAYLDLLLDQLEIDRDLDLVADGHTAGLEQLVPGEPEVLAVDLRRGTVAGALAAPRILPAAFLRHGQRHFLLDVLNREVARHLQPVPVGDDLRASEAESREPVRIEEVGGAQVRVSLILSGIDAR